MQSSTVRKRGIGTDDVVLRCRQHASLVACSCDTPSTSQAFLHFDDGRRCWISSTYHAWRGENCAGKYADVAGFCKSAITSEISSHGHVLTPGRCVGAEEVQDDGDTFEAKFSRLVTELESQFAESEKMEVIIGANIKSLNFTT